jgi:EmrB/QacA subfamily drug resistance transporter
VASPSSLPLAEETHGIPADVYHRRKAILAVLCGSLILIVVAVSSLNTAIPTIQRGLDASPTELQWIIDSYALVFAGFLLPAGAIGDRFGRKGALLTGLVIFGVCSFIASRADSAATLIGARAAMGVGAALVMPATLSIIQNSFPPHERAKAVATWAGLAGAGGAVGPLLSGVMLKWFGWASVFLINIPIVIVLLVLVGRIVPTSRDPEGHPLDPLGAIMSVLALGSLVFGIIEGPEWGWTSVGVVTAFASAIIFGIGFVMWESRIEYPTLDPRLFRLPGFGMGSLSISTIFFCMFGMFFLATQYLQYVKGYTPLEAGVRTLPSAAVMVTLSPQSPRIVGRFGVRATTRLGFSFVVAGFIVMSRLEVYTSYFVFMIGLMVLAAGMALIMPPSTSSIIGSLPLAKAGVGSAVNDVTREVGGAIGIAVMGSVLNSVYRSTIDLSKARALIPPAFRTTFAPAARAAEASIGQATGVAASMKGRSDEVAAGITAASRSAFVQGTSVAFALAAGVALLGGLIVSTRIPDELAEGQANG